MFNNLFCRFWQVINLVKKDQHSLKSCVDLFFLNFIVSVFWVLMSGIKHVCQTRFWHIFDFMFSRRFSLRIRLKYFKTKIILFALILKVITSICNETIFHLIVKSTLAKLCGGGGGGVGIVYLIFLLTEMKCHDSWQNVFLSSTMINKMLDKWQLTENLTVWELWFFKAVTSYCGERVQVTTRLTTVTRQTGKYKVDLTRHPKFPLAFGELASGHFPHCDF